jgi:O-antigen/teichoic acid export membrane protein
MKIASSHVLLAILFSNVTLLLLMKRVKVVNISRMKKLINPKEFKIQYYTYLFPLLILSVLVYLISNGGRLIAQFSFDTYSFAFASSAIGLGSRVFLSIVTPIIALTNGKVYRDSHRKTLSKSRLNKYVLLYVTVGLCICIFLFIFQTPIGLLFLSPRFISAFRFIPFAGFAALLGTAVFFYEQHFFAFSRLKLVVIGKLISLASLYIFSIIFIGKFSITGLFMALIVSASIELLFAFVAFNLLSNDNFLEN